LLIGRKGLYEDWLADDKLILLEGWARDGLTDEQIAHNMGIGYTTFKEWKSRFPSFAAVLKKGKEVVDFEVENALLKKALGGDTTAMIFWLKNRKPKQWRDHPEIREDSELLTTAKKLLEGVNSVID
jgi:hypothetical protein